MESLYYFEFCVVILSCCLKINKIKVKKKKKIVEQNAFKFWICYNILLILQPPGNFIS